MPDLSALFAAYTAAVNEATALEAEVAQTLATAKAKIEAAAAAFCAAAPPNVELSTTPDHPPLVKVVDGRIELVTKPFLGDPNLPATDPAAPIPA